MKTKQYLSHIGLVLEGIAIASLIAQAILILAAWNTLPEVIPVHFDWTGNPDGFGNKSDLLLLLGLSIATYVGLTWLGRYPEKFNYPWTITEANADHQYHLAAGFLRVMKTQIVMIFAFLAWRTVAISANEASGLGKFIVPVLLAATGTTFVTYILLASRSAGDESRPHK